MAIYSVAGRSTGAGSTTLPVFSLYSPAGSGGAIREIGVFNTTATAVVLRVARITTTGTQGSGLTEVEYDEDSPPPLMTAFDTHTSTGPTLGAGSFRQAALGAAVGSGVIWTFGGRGLVIPPATTNGIGVIVAAGTGQILDFYIDWEE
jgi:hypothetical protein